MASYIEMQIFDGLKSLPPDELAYVTARDLLDIELVAGGMSVPQYLEQVVQANKFKESVRLLAARVAGRERHEEA